MGTVGFIVLLVLLFYFLFLFNKVVYLKNLVKQAEADIDVFLKKRHDLLGKLIETVKGYADYEKSTIENVVRVRNLLAGGQVRNGKVEGDFKNAIKTLFALAENYPVLKANQNFLELQKEITKIEEDLQRARRYYNGTVRAYNTFIEKFPNLLIARLLSLKPFEYLDFEGEE